MSTSNGNTMVPAPSAPLEMVGPPAEALARLKVLEDFVKSVMVRDVDYGDVPGTNGRRSLFQPGAQKLAEVYGLVHRFEIQRTEDWSAARPFFFYSVRCELTRGDRFIGEGYGSANSRESHYAYRWAWPNELGPELDKSRLKRRDFVGRKGQKLTKYRTENEDICDLPNTLQKMACKRALVHAIIAVTRSSGMFTQDIEDGVPAEETRRNDAPEDDGPDEVNWTVPTLIAAMGAATTGPALHTLGQMANRFTTNRDELLGAYKAALARIDAKKT